MRAATSSTQRGGSAHSSHVGSLVLVELTGGSGETGGGGIEGGEGGGGGGEGEYKLTASLPVHLALRIAFGLLGSRSQKLKPNISRWKKETLFSPQKPSCCKVVHRARLHLIDLPKGRGWGHGEISERGVSGAWRG